MKILNVNVEKETPKEFASKEEQEKLKEDEEKVIKLVEKFVQVILKEDYESVLNLTKGVERDFYYEFVKKNRAIKEYGKKIDNPIKEYFKDYKGYKIFFTYVDLELNKAVVYCDFEFNYHDYLKRKISKIRRVHYFLEKEEKSKLWKIVSSKLRSEFLLYKDYKGIHWFH